MVLKVAELGHPVLRKKSEPIAPKEIPTPLFQRFVDDMIDTMREYEGVGLAGPQVRVGRRIFVVEADHSDRYPGSPNVPVYVAINPTVKILDATKVILWEGCLSVPEWRAPVERAKKVQLEALDRHGKPFKLIAQGFHARIVQHEFDHLEGKVYLDRLKNLKEFTHTSYLR